MSVAVSLIFSISVAFICDTSLCKTQVLLFIDVQAKKSLVSPETVAECCTTLETFVKWMHLFDTLQTLVLLVLRFGSLGPPWLGRYSSLKAL